MTEPSKPPTPVHFTHDGLHPACRTTDPALRNPLHLAFDLADPSIDCAGCNTYLAGHLAGKASR